MAHADPKKHVVWIGGDCNVLAPGEMPLSLASPMRARDVHSATIAPRPQSIWRGSLKLFVELHQNVPTRFNPISSSSSRLDRIYSSIPPWALVSTSCKAHVVKDTKQLHDSGISDHAPISMNFSLRKSLPRDQRPIPRGITELPRFSVVHDALVAAAALDLLSPVARWQQHKHFLRQAAMIVRDEACVLDPTSSVPSNFALSAVARCVWTNDIRVARILIRQSPIGREYLCIQSDGVSLTDPEVFHAMIQQEKQTLIQARLQTIDNDFPVHVNGHRGQTAGAAKKRSKKDALMRLARLWSPFDKRLVLAGIRTGQNAGGNYTIAKSPTTQLDALRTAWAPTFDKKMSTAREANNPWMLMHGLLIFRCRDHRGCKTM